MASIDAFFHLAEHPRAHAPPRRRWEQRLRERQQQRDGHDRLFAVLTVIAIFVLLFFGLRSAMRPPAMTKAVVDEPLTIIYFSTPQTPVVKQKQASFPSDAAVRHGARSSELAPLRSALIHAPTARPDALQAVTVNPTAPTRSGPDRLFGPDGLPILAPAPVSSPPPRDLLASRPVRLPGRLDEPLVAFQVHDESTGQRVAGRLAAVFGGGSYDPCPDIKRELVNDLDDPGRAKQAEEHYERACEGR
jgi:hypothetical protein